jgi:hypothetical protein
VIVLDSHPEDFEKVRDTATSAILALGGVADELGLGMRVGVVGYTYHTEPDWLGVLNLTENLDELVGRLASVAAGSAGDHCYSDLYAAIAAACGERVGGKAYSMAWRPGSVRLLILIPQLPPESPDSRGRRTGGIADLLARTGNIRIVGLLATTATASLLNSTGRAVKALAKATGGETILAEDSDRIAQPLGISIAAAIRDTRNVQWRQTNPPYGLYSAIIVQLAVIVCALLVMILRQVNADRPPGGSSERIRHIRTDSRMSRNRE